MRPLDNSSFPFYMWFTCSDFIIVARWSLWKISSSAQSHLPQHNKTGSHCLLPQRYPRKPLQFIEIISCKVWTLLKKKKKKYLSCWWIVPHTATWTKLRGNCKQEIGISVSFRLHYPLFDKWLLTSHITRSCNSCRASSTSRTALSTSAATCEHIEEREKNPWCPGNVCRVKGDFAGGIRPTSGAQVQSESAGTSSSTTFHPVSCGQDEKTSRHRR